MNILEVPPLILGSIALIMAIILAADLLPHWVYLIILICYPAALILWT